MDLWSHSGCKELVLFMTSSPPLYDSGRAYRQCDLSGNWELVPSNNRTWANYTECTRYLMSDHRKLEEVCIQSPKHLEIRFSLKYVCLVT